MEISDISPFILLFSDTCCPTMSSQCGQLRTQASLSLSSSVFLCIRSTFEQDGLVHANFLLSFAKVASFWNLLTVEFNLSLHQVNKFIIEQHGQQAHKGYPFRHHIVDRWIKTLWDKHLSGMGKQCLGCKPLWEDRNIFLYLILLLSSKIKQEQKESIVKQTIFRISCSLSIDHFVYTRTNIEKKQTTTTTKIQKERGKEETAACGDQMNTAKQFWRPSCITLLIQYFSMLSTHIYQLIAAERSCRSSNAIQRCWYKIDEEAIASLYLLF